MLTYELIVTRATQLADNDGIEQLSMRRLAADLDCGVMSLYHYVADKEALIEAIVDQVAGEVMPPPGDLDWRGTVKLIAESTLEAQLRHPWAVPIWSATWPGPNRFALVEQLLGALADADLRPDIADLGFHAISNHIQGFAQQKISFGQLDAKSAITAERVQALVADADFPRVVEHLEFHRSGQVTPDEFVFTLELILDALENYDTASS